MIPKIFANKKLIMLAGASALLLTTGCANTARVTEMALQPSVNAAGEAEPSRFKGSRFENAIYVESTRGGQRIHPLLSFKVDNAGFKGALEASLASQNLLCKEKSECTYGLTGELISFSIPAHSINAKVTSTVNYYVSPLQTESVAPISEGEPKASDVFNVTAVYTAVWTDALYAPNRPLLGAEGSIKENIKMFLNKLEASAL